MKTPVDVSGKFTRVSAFTGNRRDSPVVVAFIGNLTKETIAPKSIEYIKWFYEREGWKHRFVDEFPDGIEQRQGSPNGNFVNDYMVIEI